MGAPFLAPALHAFLGALLLGALKADEACPSSCSCSLIDDLDLSCQLNRTAVTIRGQPGSHIEVTCNDGGHFTFDEFPQLSQGLEQDIRLELHHCALPPSFALARKRLGAGSITQLYLYDPPEGEELTAEMVKELDKLEWIAIYADRGRNVTIPTEAFTQLPSLIKFTVNNGNLLLRGNDFATAPNLVFLELTSTNLRHLPDDLFRPLRKLKKLLLWSNKLEELTVEQLESLESLQQLDISQNKLKSLSGLAGTKLPLVTLIASRNNFTEIPPLRNLSRLQELKIFQNLQQLKISPQALASLPYLENVTLNSCRIQHFPNDTFSGSQALKKLELPRNNMSTLPEELFSGLTALKVLDLSRCNIQKLEAKLFRPLIALQTLKLDYNLLTTLPPNGLSSLYVLTSLSVSHNRLRTLSKGMLQGADKLVKVDFSYNNITEPDYDTNEYNLFDGMFSQRTNLREINLSHNQMTSIPPSVSATLIFLENLDLSYNRLEEITYLNFVSNKLKVDLRHNRIRGVYPAGWVDTTQKGAVDNRERATVLLEDNPFFCDCNMFNFALRLNGFKSHDTIEANINVGNAKCAGPPTLANKAIRSIPLQDYTCKVNCSTECDCLINSYKNTLDMTCKKAPRSYPNANEYSLSSIQLRLNVTPTVLNLTESVSSVNMSGLSLKDMPAGRLPQSLKLLDISNNNFSVIPSSLLEREFRLKVAGNPLICDCWHADDIQVLQDKMDKIEDYDYLHCVGDSIIPVKQVVVPQLCLTWKASVIGGVLAMFGILTIIAAVLLLKYSFEIKVWLYARGMFARWLVVDDDDRRYDAFVSFCHKDEDFVSEHLLPGLENVPQPYKLCIHYRDWMPGEFITTQIAQSVADSRRTIIVVSKNFLESQWARAEFRTANMSAIKEGKTRVIAILLEDVNSHKELDPELKAYLSTNTYLKWGDPWFWDKLKYALPHRKVDSKSVKRKEKAKLRAKAKAVEARKVVGACGLDTRLNADGKIINAAALLPAEEKKGEQINLDICDIDKLRSISDMKPMLERL